MLNLYLIILLPLIGFLINAFVGKSLPKNVSGIIGSASILGSFILSSIFFIGFLNGTQQKIDVNVFDWISFGDFKINFGILLDQLSVTWLMVITLFVKSITGEMMVSRPSGLSRQGPKACGKNPNPLK